VSDERLSTTPALIGLGTALALFYWGDALPLAPLPQLLTLLLLAEFALLRPDLVLLMVSATAPLYLIPAEIPGLRAEPLRLPLHEVVLLATAATAAGRWAFERVRPRTKNQEPRTKKHAGVWPLVFGHSSVVRYAPHLLLLVAGIVGVLLAVPEGRGAALREFRWLIAGPLLFYALLRAQIAADPLQRTRMVIALVASGSVVALIGLLQFAGLDLAPLFGQKQNFGTANVVDADGLRRATSVYGHPNNLGLFLGRVWPFAAVLALAGLRATDRSFVLRPSPFVFGVAALLCLSGIAVSVSRGAWLGVVAAGGVLAAGYVWMWSSGEREKEKRRRGEEETEKAGFSSSPLLVFSSSRLLPGLIAAVVALAVLAGLALSLRGGLGGGSVDARVLLWREALALIQAHPLGLGLDQFYYYHNPEFGRSRIDPSLLGTSEQYASHPHNLLLDAYLNVGPLGVLALAWLLLRFFRQGMRQLGRNSSLALGAVAAMVAGLTHGMVDVFYFVEDLAILFWLLLALVQPEDSSAG
jgi:putative inorganic carbon (hco3(-)) transporter